ncbi:5'-methylthioadenosine/adenosylhomocysteine nucleosidase [Candidatus Woesearchaeota archaeon]|nr:5'-methylthioadenosine/adenosylhomocysteine nucleosidase [Candidatus Woesearchaeota archaeon]
MNIKIGIIGAMKGEVVNYFSGLKNKELKRIAKFVFYSGKLCEKDVVIAKGGVGKVNAAVCTQVLIDRFDVSLVIFTGVSGALNPLLKINDIVVSKECIQHDMDARSLGFELGQIPFTKQKAFKSSEKLRKIAVVAAKSLGLNVFEGRILTGDKFVTDKKISGSLRKVLKGDCIDMESAAVAHACTLNGIPHIIIRTISDKADHSAPVDFSEFCGVAAKNSFKIVSEMLKLI